MKQRIATGDTTTLDHKYIYDGWNMIAEVDALSSNQIVRSYTWGLDQSGTLTGSGGTGGLVEVTNFAYSGGSISGTTDYFAGHDGNGNLAALVNSSTGAVAQAYEYSPFGEVLTWTNNDSAIQANPFGFADKYTDSETGLVYYGKRLYSPTLGRFINRDPAEEAGGVNLYGFCGNDSVNGLDVLGNYPASYGANYVPPALIHPPGLNDIGPLGTYKQLNFGEQFQPTISAQDASSEIDLEMALLDTGGIDGLNLALGVLNGSVSIEQASAYLAFNQNSGATLTAGMIQGMLQAGPGTYTPSEAIALGNGIKLPPAAVFMGAPIPQGAPGWVNTYTYTDTSGANPNNEVDQESPEEAADWARVAAMDNAIKQTNQQYGAAQWSAAMQNFRGLTQLANVVNTAVTIEYSFVSGGEPEAVLGDLNAAESDTALLQAHLDNAVARFNSVPGGAFTDAQADALVDNPQLASAFRGERIDAFFRESVGNDPALDHLELTPRGQFGPDVFNPETQQWWDATTAGQWDAHVQKYWLFGNGTPLLH